MNWQQILLTDFFSTPGNAAPCAAAFYAGSGTDMHRWQRVGAHDVKFVIFAV
ncbi:MAG: hypothetical protein ACLFVO_23940 [Chloroflexaceae bacterium]